MMYQFTGKQILILIVCLAVLGFLTFSAGVLAGLGMAMPTRAELALLKTGKPLAVATGAPPKLPAAVPKVAELESKLPAVAAAGAANQPAPAAVPAPPAAAAPPVVEPPAPAAVASSPAAQAANEAPAAAPAIAPAAAPAAPAASAPPAAPEFALQLGSFRDLNNAKQMQAELKDRGYNTSILTALDADQREWHVVRMDGFKTLASASQAAAQFIDKERIPAVIRRAKAL